MAIATKFQTGMRVLFLASYFPKPDNPLMGTWALAQAQALVRCNINLRVVSCTSWVPKLVAPTSGAKAYAHCPNTYVWPGEVNVDYLRWLYYPVPPVKTWAYKHPQPYLSIAWHSVKRKLIDIVQTFQPDIIFCHHLLPNGWIAAQLPDNICPPIITLDHDFDEITDCHQYPYRHAAMKRAVKQAWASLAVSNRMQQSFQALFPHEHFLIHHNGIDLPPAQLDKQPRPPAVQNKKIVLSCALFAERKGIPLLIKAFCSIAPHHPDAILRIIGNGPENSVIRETIQQHDRTHQVQLLGKKPHHEVLQEMAWADCFALVGWDEPFATVYLEAMAAGKPIICCRDGGINDVFQHQVHGYAVAPKDLQATASALDKMLSDDAARLSMGHHAKQLIHEQLTWDAKASHLCELFSEAVAGAHYSGLQTR
ncbi:MAG: glycosyltransferase family 4 protein [Leptolyngbyaceae bacterium]|nr:glycosyltransferase family 4 protein [Leptolyngbyaceae bacterium]